MIHLLLGADEYLAAGWLAAQKARLGDPEMAGLNTVDLNGNQTAISAILGEASMMPFLSEHRLVIVRGLLDGFEKRIEASKRTDAAIFTEVAQFFRGLSALPDTSILVLVDNSVDKRRALWKGFALPASGEQPERRVDGLDALIKAGIIRLETLAPPDVKGLPGWLLARARERKLVIDGAAVNVLCDFVGPNLRQLDNELEKLSLYADGRPITQQDVRAMVADVGEEKIWALTDAVSQRQGAKAMRALHDLRGGDQGGPIYIVSMIARQYRMLIEVKSLVAAGQGDPNEMAKRLGYSAYPVQKAMQLSHQYTFGELEDILARLLEADMAMKTGADQGTELDVLVAELCMRRGQRIST